MMRFAVSITATWEITLFVILAGCRPVPTSSSPRPTSQSAKEVRTEVERGPVRASVQVAPTPVRLSDEPTMTLTIDYEIGVDVEKPPFGEAVGDFLIRDFRDVLPEVNGRREVIRQRYKLEPTLTGAAH